MSVAAEPISQAPEKKIEIQPVIAVVNLEPRPQDKVLNPEEFEIIEFFDKLDKLPPLGRYPGAVVLRRFDAGDVICRQGEPGHSAFYVLTDADVDHLHELDPEIGPAVPLDPSVAGRIGSIYVLPGHAAARPTRSWQFWKRTRTSAPKSPEPVSIPNDGVEDIDPKTRCADLRQGDIFGEMSCMTFAPRSATVRVERDCWLLELNRNIFDGLQRDKGYRKHVDDLYVARALNGQLQRFELFSDLNPTQLEVLRDAASLELLEPGSIICEEGDVEQNPDVFLIRSGVVQVVKNAIVSLKAHEIGDWPGFCKALLAAAGPTAAPAAQSAASPADSPSGAPTRSGKPSPAQMLAEAKRKSAEKAAGSAAPPPAAGDPKPAAKITPAEIMARAKQAREAKEASAAAADQPVAAEPAPPKPGKPSTAEIMAAARRKTAAAEATPPPVAPAPPATPAEVTPPRKPTTAEIMAAARAKATAATPSGAEPPSPAEPAAAAPPPPPKAKPSPAEILAAQKKKLAAAAPADSPDSASPAAPKATPAAAAVPRGKPSAAEMLAAVRQKRAAGQVADDTPETALRTSITRDIARPQPAVFAWLSDRVQEAVRTIASAPVEPPSDARQLVVNALNELLRSRPFVMSPPVADLLDHSSLRWRVQSCPKGIKGIKDAWSDVEVRHVGRTLLTLIFPEFVANPGEKIGAARILAYRTRGDVIGEMALVLNAPRSATCIAYDHPPDPKGKREPGRLELVRIKGAVFRKLMADDPELNARVRKLAEGRKASDAATAANVDDQAPLASAEFHELGLFQGQKLLVIDLDSCTRCGDCMRACVETHDDGRSRLFLDGPRFDRFLIPSACRQCLNPLCMIGCPVGSIQRGDNGQIEIEDWCIGCCKCAEQCPYDSIQMHDIGIVTDIEAGWRFAPLRRVKDGWQKSKSGGAHWGSGLSPFAWTAEFRNAVAALDPLGKWTTASTSLPDSLCFRLTFDASAEQLRANQEFRLLVTAPQLDIQIWLNGQPRPDIYRDDKMVREGQFAVKLKRDELRKHDNILAVQVASPSPLPYGAPMLSARLDAIPEAGSMVLDGIEQGKTPEIKLVTERAVVCDLCSHIPGQDPACVSQCPHDAAMRINPLAEFGRIWNR